MSDFTFTSPEGKKYTVTGPEGATKEQAFEVLQKQIKPDAPAEPSTTMDVLKEGGKGLLRGAASFAGDMGEAVMGPFGPSHHFANLKADLGFGEKPAPEPGYGEQIAHATGVEASPKTTLGKYAGTTGQVLGNPTTYLGPGSAATKVLAGTASALGSEGAGQLAESAGAGEGVQTAARLAGGLVGGTGTAAAAAERNLSKLAAQLPTRDSIKAAATAGYDMLKQSNVRISPQGTQDLLASVKNDLHADHFRDYLAPTTYRAIEELGASGSATIGDLDGVRRLLGRVPGTNPTDRAAANKAISAIDDFLTNVPAQHVMSGDPARDAAILKHAQGNWALHKQLETLEDASVKGQHRAGVSGSGANSINTARQEVRKILDSDKKSRGMSDAVKEKMEEIVMGTWLTNAARKVGKFAPSGPVSSGATIAAGFAGGAPAAAATAGTGFIAKHLGEYLTDKQIRELEQMMRSESPIGKPIARAIAPEVAEQKAVPAAAATRAALTSPLAPDGP